MNLNILGILTIYYPFLIILSFLPSFIWLLFYLRKDAHPESNSMIIRVFFLGMFFALFAIFIELFFRELINCRDDLCFCQKNFQDNYKFLLMCFLNNFIGVAFTEELMKYLVVKFSVLKNSEFDEPLDVMLYMVISGLGFVAVENLLLVFSAKNFNEIFILLIFRFISATFLHALTSGALGYFMAVSFRYPKKRIIFLFFGFFLAVILHGFYNFYIMREELVNVILIVAGLAILVSILFGKVKNIKSTCEIN